MRPDFIWAAVACVAFVFLLIAIPVGVFREIDWLVKVSLGILLAIAGVITVGLIGSLFLIGFGVLDPSIF